MNDHQTWSVKLMVQILDFDLFKYSSAIKTISEEDINGWHPAQFDRDQKKLDKIS